jgi:hypothetical protein
VSWLTEGMVYKIEYISDRDDVWRWYWRSWRRHFWRLHAALFLGAGFFVFSSMAETSSVAIRVVLAAALVCCQSWGWYFTHSWLSNPESEAFPWTLRVLRP